MTKWKPITKIAFCGARFEGGGPLDVEAMPDLAAYRALVISVAKELWRRDNPTRERLPRDFGDEFRLRCSGIEEGSSVAALERSLPSPAQLALNHDAFESAMVLVDETVIAAAKGAGLPAALPRSALVDFEKWGRRLRSDEWIEVRSDWSELKEVPKYSQAVRAAIVSRLENSYEDAADVEGVVLEANLRTNTFQLYASPDSGAALSVPLPSESEETVVEALAHHVDTRVRVRGRAMYSPDGELLRLVQTDAVEVVSDEVVDNGSLWAALAGISASVSDEDWLQVPSDGSKNVDQYLA